MAKFDIKEHEKRMRDILKPQRASVGDRLREATLKLRKGL